MGLCCGKKADKDSKDCETQSVNVNHIEKLPNEMLVKIFDYLDFTSKFNAQNVCLRWNQVMIYELKLKKCLIISDQEMKDHEDMDFKIEGFDQKFVSFVNLNEFKDEIQNTWFVERKFRKIIGKIVSNHNGINTISICLNGNFSKYHKSILELVAINCEKSLCKFSFECNVWKEIVIKPKEVKLFCKKFPNIKYLNINFKNTNIDIREESIEVMFKQWKDIEVFRISKFDNKCRRYICSEDLNPNIRCFGVMNGHLWHHLSVDLETMAANKLSHLEELYTDWFDFYDIIAFELIKPHLKSLKAIHCRLFFYENDISGGIVNNGIYKDLNQIGFALLFTRIFKIANLELIDCESRGFYCITIDDYFFRDIENCKKLKTLKMKSFTFTGNGFECLAGIQCLEELVLDSIEIQLDIDRIIAVLSMIPNLKNLVWIRNCTFSNSDVIIVVNYCHRLLHLNIDSISVPFKPQLFETFIDFSNRRSYERYCDIVIGSEKIRFLLKAREIPVIFS